jgi:hypothetical protein
MRFAASLQRRLPWLNVPTGALIALLQRSPVVQAVASGAAYAAVSPVATVLKSAAAAIAALGAVDALAGATALIESNNQSGLTLAAGTPMQPVIFGVSNTINIGSWRVGGAFPPGLKLVAAEGGASLSAPGILDATNLPADILQTTPILEGTPTAAGTYTLTLQAFEFSGLQGLASNVFSYTVTVTGSGSSSGGSSGTGGSGTTGADAPPVPVIAVDGHSNGDTITLAAGASGLYQVAARFKAADSSNNLSGIRFNYWNPPAGSTVPFAGLFNNGGGFVPESGGYGEVDQNVTLTPGDWYFWTDAQNAHGDSTSTGAWTAGYILHVKQGAGATTTTTPAPSAPLLDVPPVPVIAVDGHSKGDTISVPAGGSATVTIRFSATDASNNLSGIRFNIWGPPAGSTVPFAGYFSSGNGFVVQTGGAGEVTQVMNLTPGDWYFWTDVQNANGDYSTTGAWTAGYVLHVVASGS